jgi:hypothetical protein
VLTKFGRPVSAEEVAGTLAGKATDSRRQQVGELLETLAVLGQARQEEDGRWSER